MSLEATLTDICRTQQRRLVRLGFARLRQGRFLSVCHPERSEGSLPSKQLLPGWLVTNRVIPSGTELRVLNHKQIRSVIVEQPRGEGSRETNAAGSPKGSAAGASTVKREPVIDDKRLSRAAGSGETQVRTLLDSRRPSRAGASECNQIGYQLELKCRDVEF